MSYGSSAYGSAAFGGSAGSVIQHEIYPLNGYVVGTHERRIDYNGAAELYRIHTVLSAEGSPTIFKIFTSNGEGETPQLQATIVGATILAIGARPIIVVEATVSNTTDLFHVYGRPDTV